VAEFCATSDYGWRYPTTPSYSIRVLPRRSFAAEIPQHCQSDELWHSLIVKRFILPEIRVLVWWFCTGVLYGCV